MARDFDGANDNISFGSDASVDNFATRTLAFWVSWDGSGVRDAILGKSANLTAQNGVTTDITVNSIVYRHDWSTGDGVWHGGTAINDGANHHVVVTYNQGATTNDPVITLNGTDETVTEDLTPSGSVNSDAGSSLRAGEFDDGANDFDGRLQWVCYDSAIWTAAQKNMHRWYGRIGGGSVVEQWLVSDDLTNKGSGTANGTATGTTVVPIPRGERRHCMMMGVGT